MRRTVSMIAALAVGSFAIVLPAQSRPDFSGRWTTAPAPAADAPAPGAERGRGAARGRRGGGRAAAAGDMGSGWGDVITIAQDATQLVVEYPFFARGDLQPPLRYTFALDGTPTTNVVMMGRGEQAQESRAAWDGTALVITSSYTFAHPGTGEPVPGTMRQRLVLESPTSLVIEVTRDGVLGGPASTTRRTYRKIS